MSKLKIKNLALAICLGSTSILLLASAKKKTYFEGDLFYSCFELNAAGDTLRDSLSLRYTIASFTMTYKNGNKYRKDYNYYGELLGTRVLNLNDMTYKYYSPESDSVVVFYTDIRDTGAEVVAKKDTLINNDKVIKVSINTFMASNYQFLMKADYYYSSELEINPDLYSNYKEGDYGKILQDFPYLYVRIDQEFYEPFYWRRVTSLDSFVRRKVDDAEFESLIPDHLPLKKI